MKTTDVELINRILNGDDTAFTELVKKYQKPVHALVWRKIGDFHIAEEITQDTFLKAYQGLANLKKSQSFASWLYVIAANNCSSWLRKKHVWTQPLEEVSNSLFRRKRHIHNMLLKKKNGRQRKHSAKPLRSCLRNYQRVTARLSHYITSVRCQVQRLVHF